MTSSMLTIQPTYSHGGSTVGPWTAVSGAVTGSGRPISVVPAHPVNIPVVVIVCTGGTATVILECNGGQLGDDGNPPAAEWVDVSGGGYTMTAGDVRCKRLPPVMPYWRTRITAIAGATVLSYVPLLVLESGGKVSASYPGLTSTGVS